jgi:hypothetical protein
MSLAASATPVYAGSVTFVTPSGATTSGGAVDASATFTSGLTGIVVQLQDLEANPTNAAQALSDLSFTVSNGSLAGATLTTSSGQLINIVSGGTFTFGSTGSTGWAFSETSGGANGSLEVLGTQSGPAHLIIGPPGNGGTYSNANGSIAGNGPHNPFLNQIATFAISGPGITADTTITAATFEFGTTAGANLVPGINLVPSVSVPEPSSLILSASGLGLLGLVGFYRSRRQRRVLA